MKVIKFFVVAAAFAASTAGLQAQTVGPTPAPAPAMIPAAGSPMPPATMDSGAMAGGNYAGPGYGGEGYCGNGYCGNGYCGNGYCGNGYCGDGACADCGPMGGCWTGGLFSHCGRSYMQIDAMMINRGRGYDQVLVTQGAFERLGTEYPNYGYETMPRITAGYVLPNDTAIEGSFFYKDDMNGSASVRSTTNNLVVAGVGSFARAQIDLSTQIQNYELNLVETTRKFNFLAGFRYIELQDHFLFNATTLAGAGAAARIDTYNSLVGGQAGGRVGFDMGLFRLEGTGKAGLFYNHGNGHTQLQPIGTTAIPQRDRGGDNQSFVGELNTQLTYRPSAALAFRAGYQIYWIVNTGLAQAQYNNGAPLTSGLSFNDRGDLILHGPSAGVDLRW